MSAPRILRLDANQPPDRFYRGGRQIADFRGQSATGERVPEDWVGSTTTLNGEATLGLTTFADGSTLRSRIADDPSGWLGAEHVSVWGADAALLVKLLDAGERLPVHIHPDRAFATDHLGSWFGKTEAWIVLEPSFAYLGFTRDVAADEAARWVREQDTSAMLGTMHEVQLERGSSILVPAGMPHAIGEGSFVIELQEPTDFSILLEWRGFDIDGEQLGHLGLGFNTALGALDRSAWSREQIDALIGGGDHAGGSVFPDAASPYFRAERHSPDAPDLGAGFSIVVVTGGEGTLESASGEEVLVARGDTLAVPFASGGIRLVGDVALVRCRPPAKRSASA